MRRRLDRWNVAAGAAVLAGAAWTLWLGRGLTFFADEWAFIEHRSLANPTTWLPPHNEHWSTIPVIAYRALVETVGMQSYLPYLLLVMALHVLVIALVHRAVRNHAGPAIALGVACVLAVFGSGFENLFWGFQIGFVGATAAGVGALLLLDRRPDVPSVTGLVVLLTIAVMTAGVGLVFLGAALVEVVAKREWRRWVAAVAIPAWLYLGWFLVWGRSGVGSIREVSVGSASQAPVFVAQGLGNAMGSLLGVGPVLGLLAAAGLVVYVAARLGRGQSLPIRTLSTATAIAALYSLIALSRAGIIADQVQYTRYTYVGTILVVLGLAPLIGPEVVAFWRSRPRVRPWIEGVGGLVLLLALSWNVRLLVGGREVFEDRATFTRALVGVAVRDPLPDGVDPERSLVYVPSPASIRRQIAAYGSPQGDVLAPEAVAVPDPDTLARAERQLRDPQVPTPENVD